MIPLTGHLAPLIAAMVLHAHHRNCTLSAVSLDNRHCQAATVDVHLTAMTVASPGF